MECLIFSTLRAPSGISDRQIQKVVAYVLKKEQRSGDVTVHTIGDTKMARLQKIHRGKEGTTDVLSFAAQEGDKITGDGTLGDIFISIPRIRKQAREWSVTFEEEFTRMLIHGLLHILGYDHIQKSEAEVMFGKQEKYLKNFK